MFRFITKNIKNSFAFMPERSKRYFTLKIAIRSDIPLSQKLYEQHLQQLKNAQQRGQVLYAVKKTQKSQFQYLFQSPNQIQAFYFVKNSVFNAHKMIEYYQIKQIEMRLKVKDKQLAPAYLRQ